MNKNAARLERVSFQFVVGLLLTFFALVIFGVMAYGLLVDDLQSFDLYWGTLIRSYQNNTLTHVMIFITMFGQINIFLTVTVLVSFLLLYYKKPILSLLFCFTVLGAWGLNEALKQAFSRSRPSIEHLILVHGYSFPSGHAMISTACYGMMGYILYLYLKQSYKSHWVTIVATVLFILLIGMSRVYLGVHYMSDVIAGFSAGGAWLFVCILIYNSMLKADRSRV